MLYDDLPRIIPIFPLKSAVILPGGMLNLTIFEPRYLEMLLDALATRPRLIGMVQPRLSPEQNPSPESNDDSGDDSDSPPGNVPVYSIGCAGRVSSFIETDDGRYIIALTGIARFRIVSELVNTLAYRQIIADWTDFATDFAPEPDHLWNRAEFFVKLKDYFKIEGIDANWKAIEQSTDWRLLTSLAMNCPFSDSEKQAIIEAKSWQKRAELFDVLISMKVIESKNGHNHGNKRN